MAKPYDKKLSELAASLEDTRLYFGDRETKERQKKKNEATSKIQQELSEAALARRATFNATASGASNFLGESELVDAISSGRIALEDIDRDDMPADMKAYAPAEQMEVITRMAAQRLEIKRDIQKLSESRNDYIRDQVAKDGGAKESLDEKIYSAVKKQAKSKGLVYESEEARY